MTKELTALMGDVNPGEKCDAAYSRLLPENPQPNQEGFNADTYVSLSDWRDCWNQTVREERAAAANARRPATEPVEVPEE